MTSESAGRLPSLAARAPSTMPGQRLRPRSSNPASDTPEGSQTQLAPSAVERKHESQPGADDKEHRDDDDVGEPPDGSVVG